jgi:hypothetical protein
MGACYGGGLPGGHVYLLVAVDKFTKWIEAVPVTSAYATLAVNFVKGIVFDLASLTV